MVSVFFSLVCLYLSLLAASATEIQVDRVEVVNSWYKENVFNFTEARVTKLNRTAYSMNFKFMFWFEYHDPGVEMEVMFYFNRLNNNQYTKSPFAVNKQPMCKLIDKFYLPFLKELFLSCTNLPEFYNPVNNENESICPTRITVS